MATRPKKRAALISIGYSVLSARQPRAVAYLECRCMTQRACGTFACKPACRYQAVGSGAFGFCSVDGSWASRSSSSLAVICEKWRRQGLIRKRLPSRGDRDAEMIGHRFRHTQPREPAESRGQIRALFLIFVCHRASPQSLNVVLFATADESRPGRPTSAGLFCRGSGR